MHGSRFRPLLPISSLDLDLTLSLDLNRGLGGQYFIFQAKRPKFGMVVDLYVIHAVMPKSIEESGREGQRPPQHFENCKVH